MSDKSKNTTQQSQQTQQIDQTQQSNVGQKTQATQQPAAQQTTQPHSSGQAQDKKTIMIVEDDPILLRMYTEKLNFEGYNVVTAKNGEVALETATNEKPDLIILDIMLPRMSGTDFLERFKKTAVGKNTPVIALTNLAEDEERQKAIELGVKEYLVKAMQTPEQVLQKVKKYL